MDVDKHLEIRYNQIRFTIHRDGAQIEKKEVNDMEGKSSITINLNFIFNTVEATANVEETIVEQVLNLDYDQLLLLAEQKEKGENCG